MSKVVVRPARYKPDDVRMRRACQNRILLRNEKSEHRIQPLPAQQHGQEKPCGQVTLALEGHDHGEGSRLEGCWPVASSWCMLLCMKRWFDAFVLVIWSLVTASTAETFAERSEKTAVFSCSRHVILPVDTTRRFLGPFGSLFRNVEGEGNLGGAVWFRLCPLGTISAS